MKKCIPLLLFLFLNFSAISQEWSEPVNVSNMEGTDYFPDFCIDGNGLFHCVWAHHYGGEHIKVFYAKSEDQGATWSEAEDVSQNSSMSCMYPHIVADTQNRLYVTYDYNSFSTTQSLIGMKIFDGNVWGEMDTVSVDMPGARRNRLVIDGNDQVYCFWYHDMNYGGIYYRTRFLEQWGEIKTPFDNNDFYATSDVCVDDENNIHLSGLCREYGQNYEDIRTFYCKLVGSSWIGFNLFGDDQCIENAVDTDEAQNPHVCWKQYTTNSIPPNDGTVYSGFNGTTWTEPELIVEDPMEQIIVVDENQRVNIFDTEKTEDGSMLVHYYQFNGSWCGYIIDVSELAKMHPKIITLDKVLYMFYTKRDENDIEAFFIYSDIVSDIQKFTKIKRSINMNLYPNPFSQKIIMDFSVGLSAITTIKIYSLKGDLLKVLVDKIMPAGNYELAWDGRGSNNQKLPSGLYLVRLQNGNFVMTRSVEYIR